MAKIDLDALYNIILAILVILVLIAFIVKGG